MVIRRDSRRAGRRQPALLVTLVAGAALVAILAPSGPAGADRPRPSVPLAVGTQARGVLAADMVTGVPAPARVAPVPGGSALPNGVTFEVLPVQPTGSPTSAPTPSPSKSGGNLPVTGDGSAPPGWLFAVGALLLLLGALVVTVSSRVRRRRA